MGRTVLADDTIQAYVNNLLGTGQWYLGLILGQLTAQKDYAVHIVRTPEPLEDQASDDDEQEDLDKSKKKRRKSQSKPASLELLNEQWPATHAKQVTTMLPGGLQVIGVFALAPPQMIQSSQAKLRQILFALHKVEKKSSLDIQTDVHMDRVLLQICSVTRKYTCRTIDISDPKSAFRPADWKYQSSSETWHRLTTNIAIDVPVELPLKMQNSSVLKQIQYCVHPFCTRLCDSLILIDGKMRMKQEMLDQSTDRKGKGRDKGQPSSHHYRCNLLLKLCSESRTVEDPHTEDKIGTIVIKGTIHSEAYIVSKSSVEEAEKALKTDVVRSLMSRCDLLCADIQVVEEDTAREENYNTPMRVFFQLPGSNIRLCDYMFADEKVQEVIERIKELLDISLEENDLDLNSERNANLTPEEIIPSRGFILRRYPLAQEEEDCVSLGKETPEGSEAGEIEETKKGFNYFIGLGGALAFFVAGLSYLLTQES